MDVHIYVYIYVYIYILAWYIFTISSISSLSSSPSDSILDNSHINSVPCPGAKVSAKDDFNRFFSCLYFC